MGSGKLSLARMPVDIQCYLLHKSTMPVYKIVLFAGIPLTTLIILMIFLFGWYKNKHFKILHDHILGRKYGSSGKPDETDYRRASDQFSYFQQLERNTTWVLIAVVICNIIALWLRL